jgi:glycosyltransferase involved in cell wall biosynthesis
LEKHGVEHFAIDQDWARPIASVGGFLKLRQVIGQFVPDIVHAHAVPGAIFACCLRKRFDFRFVTSVHNLHRWASALMGMGDVVISVSSAVAASMQRRGVPSHKLRVVKNGPLGSPRRSVQFLPDNRTIRHPAIVTVAGLLRNKGISDLITAFALVSSKAPEASLYIIGDGPERTKLEAEAATSGCSDKIHFTGFVKDPRPYLFAADIFVLASYREAFGLVLAEAREAGCAIVASDVGGVPEVLDGGEAGILLPAGQPRVLANILAFLLSNGCELSKWQTRASQNLDWLANIRAASEILAVYDEAMQAATKQAEPFASQRLTRDSLSLG